MSLNLKYANNSPVSASPAIIPEAASTPTFSTRAFCASFRAARLARVSLAQRIKPPKKIADVMEIGRYIPIATSIGLFTLIMISAKPIMMPATTSGHAISPPTIPCASDAINPACGAESARSPKPIPPVLMFACCSTISGKYMIRLATTTAISSAIWM